jgi:hypothetical protein
MEKRQVFSNYIDKIKNNNGKFEHFPQMESLSRVAYLQYIESKVLQPPPPKQKPVTKLPFHFWLAW